MANRPKRGGLRRATPETRRAGRRARRICDHLQAGDAGEGDDQGEWPIACHHSDGAPGSKVVGDAIVEAARKAKAKLAPATVGYARTTVDLNVNRDLFNSKLEWRQEPNLQGMSDKTLSVIEFIGADYIPIGVYMNYAMHPINFYLSGVISADFPGEASRAIEEHFDHRTVAIFTQGTSGDQLALFSSGVWTS